MVVVACVGVRICVCGIITCGDNHLCVVFLVCVVLRVKLMHGSDSVCDGDIQSMVCGSMSQTCVCVWCFHLVSL